MVIVIVNPKGGVGKSTLAQNIAVELFDRGVTFSFLDGESGGPTEEIINAVAPEIRTRNPLNNYSFQEAIEAETAHSDHILIDLPGESDNEIAVATTHGDFVIIPMQPSEKDLKQTVPLLKLLRAHQLRTGGQPEAIMVFTFTKKRDRSATAFRNELEPLGLPIAKTQIRRLDDYRDNHIVMRVPALDMRGAATDIRLLIDEVLTPRLKRRADSRNEVVNG